jgi:hypothetical protein
MPSHSEDAIFCRPAVTERMDRIVTPGGNNKANSGINPYIITCRCSSKKDSAITLSSLFSLMKIREPVVEGS